MAAQRDAMSKRWLPLCAGLQLPATIMCGIVIVSAISPISAWQGQMYNQAPGPGCQHNRWWVKGFEGGHEGQGKRPNMACGCGRWDA
mmetsp:Transcript_136925/g.237960  ORF Transcript_136925/g.237960 Transcript_136925/m.237960 type:complete len:87 (+) Transcript_136925:679-939(+)